MAGSVTYGELQITVTTDITQLWNDRGSGASRDGAFFGPAAPIVSGGYRVLAHLGRPEYGEIAGKVATVLARDVNPSNDLLRPPVDYERVAPTVP
ncbi:hypothetical protein NJL88_29020 [Streptomyces sp. DK15]|nr:hypothetical protein [Streptomyces sp. DK15]